MGSVAARGVYLLSFLPETDVNRIVNFAVDHGKRSFAALLPDNAYGSVVESDVLGLLSSVTMPGLPRHFA